MVASTALQVAGGVGEIVLVGAWAGYVEVKGMMVAHAAAELKKEREGVQLVASRTIEQIIATPELPALPKIFDAEFKASVLTSETLRGLIDKRPKYLNKFLDQYVRHIMSALGYLYEYHTGRLARAKKTKFLGLSIPFTQGSERYDDITSSVICWLILQIGDKCVDVDSYDKVISYLTHIIAFTSEFASIKSKDSYRFKKLTPVIAKLKLAKRLLEDHKISLSLTERVKEVLEITSTAASNLIMACAKLIVPNEHWDLLATFIPERLAKGNLQEHLEYEVYGVPKTQPLIKLPNSKLATYVKISAIDYLRALDIEDSGDDDFINPAKFELTETDAENIIKSFHGCHNFLTLKARRGDGTEAVNELMRIAQEDALPRGRLFLGFIISIFYMNIARKNARLLRDGLIELGQRYFESPEEAAYMFKVVSAFRGRVIHDVNEVLRSLNNLEELMGNALIPVNEGDGIFNEIKTGLELIKTKVDSSLQALVTINTNRVDLHEIPEREHTKPVTLNRKDPMLVNFNLIATRLRLPIDQQVLQEGTPVVLPELSTKEKLDKEICAIHKRIDLLVGDAVTSPDGDAVKFTDQYKEVYLCMLSVFLHSLRMATQKNQKRIDKADHLQKLLLKQCTEFHRFLNKLPPDRHSQMGVFVGSMVNSTQGAENSFLDVHDPKSHWVVRFFKSKLMNTTSRNKENELVAACKGLQRIR
jgi:hypothetical protein